MDKILLVGGTSYTLFVAEYLYNKSMLAGVINTSSIIKTNSKERQHNVRYINLKEWCQSKKIYFRHFKSSSCLIQSQEETKSNLSLLAGVHSIITDKAIKSFPLGMYAIHASNLPKLKGWSPLNWAIILGLKQTAVTLFKVSSGIDDGPILSQIIIDIPKNCYIGDLLNILNKKTEILLNNLINCLKTNHFKLVPQKKIQSSFVLKRKEEDSKINWNLNVHEVHKLIRASSRPYLGAFSYFKDNKVTIYRASVGKLPVFGRNGQLFKLGKFEPLSIICKGGYLILEDIKVDGQENGITYLSSYLNECLGE